MKETIKYISVQDKEYGELSKIVKVLDDMINNIGIVIDEAPTIILMATILIPKKMKDISTISEKLQRDGYNIEYLNIEYNIEETNKKIGEIMDRLNVLNLQDSIFELKTLLDYYEGLYNDFDAEKRGKKEYEGIKVRRCFCVPRGKNSKLKLILNYTSFAISSIVFPCSKIFFDLFFNLVFARFFSILTAFFSKVNTFLYVIFPNLNFNKY